MVSQQPRIRLSKRQKRIQRQQYSIKDYEISKTNPGAIGKVYTVAGDFRQSQRDDPSLKNAWQKALHNEEHGDGPKFLIQNHLLYRLPQSTDGSSYQDVGKKGCVVAEMTRDVSVPIVGGHPQGKQKKKEVAKLRNLPY
ncbi:hypothetical protein NDU88_001909 [Pleurodeles waltl]|uniref:Uncharacterized protein n=1 Tax=Pleurodeles waltl TaxID=8319 RepID=A0AAV7R8H1_PLEWA|nr:hypothetical protein NDU88_001909 [Pleurodeles waltl]